MGEGTPGSKSDDEQGDTDPTSESSSMRAVGGKLPLDGLQGREGERAPGIPCSALLQSVLMQWPKGSIDSRSLIFLSPSYSRSSL